MSKGKTAREPRSLLCAPSTPSTALALVFLLHLPRGAAHPRGRHSRHGLPPEVEVTGPVLPASSASEQSPANVPVGV